MPAAAGNIYSVTWSGGVGTFTVFATNAGTAIAVDGGGNLFVSGSQGFSIPNSLITPGGVATNIVQSFFPVLNIGAYDVDRCPIIANGASNFLYKLNPPLASTTWTQITSTAIGLLGGIAVYVPSRTIYVLDRTNNFLRIFSPNY
jgi:hypothetical protein